jgi:hypothetical protein
MSSGSSSSNGPPGSGPSDPALPPTPPPDRPSEDTTDTEPPVELPVPTQVALSEVLGDITLLSKAQAAANALAASLTAPTYYVSGDDGSGIWRPAAGAAQPPGPAVSQGSPIAPEPGLYPYTGVAGAEPYTALPLTSPYQAAQAASGGGTGQASGSYTDAGGTTSLQGTFTANGVTWSFQMTPVDDAGAPPAPAAEPTGGGPGTSPAGAAPAPSISLPDAGPPAPASVPQAVQSGQATASPLPPAAHYDPMAGRPVARWLLYGSATPIRDFLTNDTTLQAAQTGVGAIAVAAATFATGGFAGELTAGYLANAGVSAFQSAALIGAAGSAAGGAMFRYGVAALAAQAGAPVEMSDALGAAFDPGAIATDVLVGGATGLGGAAAMRAGQLSAGGERAFGGIGSNVSALIADDSGSLTPGPGPGSPNSAPPSSAGTAAGTNVAGMASRQVGAQEGLTFVEIGAGDLEAAIDLAKRGGVNVIAVDPASAPAGAVQQLEGLGGKFVQGVAADVAPATADHVFQYYPWQIGGTGSWVQGGTWRLVDDTVRLLKPDGAAHFVTEDLATARFLAQEASALNLRTVITKTAAGAAAPGASGAAVPNFSSALEVWMVNIYK